MLQLLIGMRRAQDCELVVESISCHGSPGIVYLVLVNPMRWVFLFQKLFWQPRFKKSTSILHLMPACLFFIVNVSGTVGISQNIKLWTCASPTFFPLLFFFVKAHPSSVHWSFSKIACSAYIRVQKRVYMVRKRNLSFQNNGFLSLS